MPSLGDSSMDLAGLFASRRFSKIYADMMKRSTIPTNVGDYIDYDPETGILTFKARTVSSYPHLPEWKARNECGRWNTRYAGKAAGSCSKNGYLRVTLFDRHFSAHVIAWVLMTGAMPGDYDVDHINLDRADNRWCNLRLATRSQNCANTPARAKNSVGLKGVSRYRAKFVASIMVRGVPMRLGTFSTAAEAATAYKQAAERSFGEFARAE